MTKRIKSRHQIRPRRHSNLSNSGDSLSVAEAGARLGVSDSTIKRMCHGGELEWFRTRGPHGHVRVLAESVENLRHGDKAAPNLKAPGAPSALVAKRENVEALALELQAERLKRDLGKLRADDAEAEQRRAEAQRAEVLANGRALAELRLQQKHAAEQRKRDKLARHREDFRRRWLQWASSVFPDWLSEYQAQALTQAVERVLAGCDAREQDSDVRRVLDATITRAVAAWLAEREACARRERFIEDAVTWRLPFWNTTDGDKARAAAAARAALSEVPLSASDAEARAVVDSAVATVRREIEDRTKAEQGKAQAEREQRQRESAKHFLVSVGVGHVVPYLAKLQAEGELWDEDLERRTELENAVRKALEDRLTGTEGFAEAQRIAREVVDRDVE